MSPVPPGRCARCLFRRELCLCPHVPRLATRTRFLIVRHAAERWRPSNTGRLAALALANCRLVDYALRDQRFDETVLGAADAVLFPDGSTPATNPRTVVVLDGTWQQARRMLQRLPGVQSLPRVALASPSVPPRRMRQPPRPDGMSTLEAIAHAIAALEPEVDTRPLAALHALAVARSSTIMRDETCPGAGGADRADVLPSEPSG